MRVRLLAATCVVAAAAVAVAPAYATPYAGHFRYLTTGTIALTGADGARWLLVVGATNSGSVESRAEQRLYIDLSRCAGSTCTSLGRWAKPLTPSEVSISEPDLPGVGPQAGSATVRTVLAGYNLDVTLSSGGVSGTNLTGLEILGPPVGAKSQVEQYSYAGGSLTLGAVGCTVNDSQGAIGEVVGVDTVGDDTRDSRSAPPNKLPAGFLAGKHPARC